MRRAIFRALIAAVCLSLPLSTHSAPWGWVVQKTSGNAAYRSASMALSPVKKGLVFDRGTIVRTGNNGKVLLVRSTESVFIGPYTTAAIARRPTPGMQTTVLLEKGQANLAVQKKSRAHFSVETPYLVAVVKGTKFKVAVTATYAEVAVQEGRVQVRALKTGKYADIVAGQKALVDKAGNLKLSGKGKLASIATGSARAAAVSQTAGAAGNLSAGGVGAQAGIGIGSGGLSVNGGASVGGASVGVGASVGSGASVGAGASVGGAQVGAGASVGGGGISVGGGVSVGGIGAGVGASVGGGSIGLGGGLSLGGKSIGGSLGLGRR